MPPQPEPKPKPRKRPSDEPAPALLRIRAKKRHKEVCVRCGAPAHHQWQICADTTRRCLCDRCDLVLNDYILRFFRDGNREHKIVAYKTIQVTRRTLL